MRIGLLVALLLSQVMSQVLFQGLAFAADTQIYRTTDADGNVVFTDSLPADRPAEPVRLKPVNTMDALEVPRHETVREGHKPTERAAAFPGYQSLRITHPRDGATIRNPHEPIAVRVQLQPKLQHGHALRVFDNGVAQEGNSLTHVERGTHVVRAAVIGADGQVLIQSPAITLYVHRTSVGAVQGSGGGEGGDQNGDNQAGGQNGQGAIAFGSAARPSRAAQAGGAAQASGGAQAASAASPGGAASLSSSFTPSR